MIVLLSPAKSLDFESPFPAQRTTQPRFIADSAELIAELRKLTPAQLATLMSISPKLAELNHERFASWAPDFTKGNSRPALFAFTGDVYQGFDLGQWTKENFASAQKTLRILSGLYGVLRPLDLMQPYRLEMGTKFATARGKNLYEFWGETITAVLNQDLKKSDSKIIVNLASNEYFSSVQVKKLTAPLITPVFKDEKNGTYKIISFFAKKARGMMADFIVRESLSDPARLTEFKTGGYRFSKKDSSDSTFVFLRKEKAASR